jgi:hypothetical protein
MTSKTPEPKPVSKKPIKPAKATTAPETPVARARRILNDAASAANDRSLRLLYTAPDMEPFKSVPRALATVTGYRQRIRDAVARLTKSVTIRKNRSAGVAEFRQEIDEIRQDMEIKKPGAIGGLNDMVNIWKNADCGLEEIRTSMEHIVNAYDQIETLLETPGLSGADRREMKTLTRDVREHYRGLSEAKGKKPAQADFYSDLEDIFRGLQSRMYDGDLPDPVDDRDAEVRPCEATCKTRPGLCGRPTTNPKYCWQHSGQD